MNRQLALLLCAAAALLLPSCWLDRSTARVDASLLRSLPSDLIKPLEWARSDAERAETVLGSARSATGAAQSALRQAELEHRVVTNGVDQANARVVIALRSGVVQRALQATEDYKSTLAVADTARLAVALAKRELEHAELFELLALERSRFAVARLDLLRGEALAEQRLAPSDMPAREDLQAEVFFRDDEVEIANQRLSAARVRLESARTAYDLSLEDARRRAATEAREEARLRDLQRPPRLR